MPSRTHCEICLKACVTDMLVTCINCGLTTCQICSLIQSTQLTHKHCTQCLRPFCKQFLAVCAYCKRLTCESCCEIPMEFIIPVNIEGVITYEKGYYCSQVCMMIHFPGFTLTTSAY